MQFLLILTCAEREKDFLLADLWDAGAKGLEEREIDAGRVELRTFFGDQDTTRRGADRFASFAPRVEQSEEVDWIEIARSFWKPMAVGERFYLMPEWDAAQPPAGRIPLRMYAGPAFGSGDHATTQLCLEALERHLRPGQSLIDIGTGTGILAVAALRLGAWPVAACEIDSLSVAFAAENIGRERAAVGLFRGSTRSLRPAAADVVVANINTTTLELLAGDLTRIARQRLVLSGFAEGNEERVVAAFKGFEPIDRRETGGWLCVVFARS